MKWLKQLKNNRVLYDDGDGMVERIKVFALLVAKN